MTSTEPQTPTPASQTPPSGAASALKSAQELFAGLRARARVGILIEGAAVLGIAAAVFVFVSYGLDRMLELERPFRIAVAAVFALVAGRIVLRRVVGPLRAQLDDDEMALAVERVEPGLHQGLISAVQFDRDLHTTSDARTGKAHGESAQLMREVVADVEQRIGRVHALRALDAKRVLRYVAVLILGLGAVTTWVGVSPTEAALWARRNLLFADQAWPRNTFLQFLDVPADGVIRIAEREDLTLRVDAQGDVPERLTLEVRFASGETADRPMDRVGDREFSARLESVLENAEVRAVGGDGETDVLRIELVPRPRVTDLQVTVTWPDYLGREPETFEPTGAGISLVRGSTLGLRARTTKPIASAALRLGQDQRIPVTVAGSNSDELTASFVPEDTVLASLDVVDRDDLGPELPPELAIRVGEDLEPALEYSTEGIGTMITAFARIPGLLRIRDDHGVFAVEGGFRTRDAEAADPQTGEGEDPATIGADAEQPFEPGPFQWAGNLELGRAEQDLEVVLDLLELNPEENASNEGNRVRPGMLLSLRFAATDAQAGGAAPSAADDGRGESDVLSLRVVTMETLQEDLRRRQDEQARELERVLDQLVLSRSVLAEIVSPTDPTNEKADEARRRIETLGRRQIALGKKSRTIAERYGRIVSEMENNRLYEPKVTRQIRDRVVDPLAEAAQEDFPTTADATFAFAERGNEDSREYAVRGYDDLIATVRRVLQQMERAESIAAIVEALRGVIRTERQAAELVEKLRDEAGAGIFGDPDPDPDDDPDKRDRE